MSANCTIVGPIFALAVAGLALAFVRPLSKLMHAGSKGAYASSSYRDHLVVNLVVIGVFSGISIFLLVRCLQ